MALCLAVSLSLTASAAENTTPQTTPPPDLQQLQKAVNEFQNNKPDQAFNTIGKLIKEQPKHVVAIFERGKMYLISGQEAKAKADFDKVVELEQDKALAHYLVGDFYAQVGKLDQAMEHINQSISMDAKMAQAYFVRALIKQSQNDSTALSDLDKAIDAEPKYVEAYLARATVYLREQNAAAAEQDLNKAINLVENKAQINLLVAQIYLQAQNFDKAIAYATASIESNASAVAYSLRANAYSGLKQFDKAIADFDKAIQLSPDIAAIYMERGVAYANMGDFTKAMADTNKAIELAPNLGMAYINRGMINLGLDKQTEARADFKKAISINANLAQLVPAEFK